MIMIKVRDYQQFKSVVQVLGRGKPEPKIFYIQDQESFAPVAIVDNALITVNVKLAIRPQSFDQDFRDAVEVDGIAGS